MEIVEPKAVLTACGITQEQLIEYAARVCYASTDQIVEGGAGKFIRKLLKYNPPHESVLEHATATYTVTCDRGISHELVRHRLASYSQESTRYCKYSNGIRVIEPENLTPAARRDWHMLMEKCEEIYLDMLSDGVSVQTARSVLPTCLATTIVVTTNMRQWRHIIRLRCDKRAHPQFRRIAKAILHSLNSRLPAVFEDLYEQFILMDEDS